MLLIIQVPGRPSSLARDYDLFENPMDGDVFTIPVVSGNHAEAIYVPVRFVSEYIPDEVARGR